MRQSVIIMAIFIVTWNLVDRVSKPCPQTEAADSYGRRMLAYSLVYCSDTVLTPKSKEFDDEQSAREFIKHAPDDGSVTDMQLLTEATITSKIITQNDVKK